MGLRDGDVENTDLHGLVCKGSPSTKGISSGLCGTIDTFPALDCANIFCIVLRGVLGTSPTKKFLTRVVKSFLVRLIRVTLKIARVWRKMRARMLGFIVTKIFNSEGCPNTNHGSKCWVKPARVYERSQCCVEETSTSPRVFPLGENFSRLHLL